MSCIHIKNMLFKFLESLNERCNNTNEGFVIINKEKIKVRNIHDYTYDGGCTRGKTEICDIIRKILLSDVKDSDGYS